MSKTVHLRFGNKLVKHILEGAEAYSIWCPGCKHAHTYYVRDRHPCWEFDGNTASPSFKPSFREYYTKKDDTQETLCHFFVSNGEIQFCGDSPHEFANRTVPLPDIPEEYVFADVQFKDIPRA
jgi:hypothetical protein